MPHILVLGGGVAGLAASAALGQSGYRVTLLEARPYLGGRAASYEIPGESAEGEIDNSQHILLRCCVNLLDFYRRLGVSHLIDFQREFYWIEPGGRMSIMRAGILPRPLHFGESFLQLKFLSQSEKLAVGRAMLAVQMERHRRSDLDRITMLDWLREKQQPPRAIERFWRQVLVSAINEELDRMAARHGFQVIWLGFLARRDSYEMGIPRVPLSALYRDPEWQRAANVSVRLRSPVHSLELAGGRVAAVRSGEETLEADHYISGLPSEKLRGLSPRLAEEVGVEWSAFSHSPITGVHLWFDRPVTNLPHGTLLDRTIQWFYAREQGRYLKLVISASRAVTALSKSQILALALRELREFLPAVGAAELVRCHVVKEMHATFSAVPGLEAHRPGPETRFPNLSLAGDWTASGWPSTMEGAVRSGYRAAGHATTVFGAPHTYLLPDIA